MSSAAIRFIFTQVLPRLPLLARLSIAHTLGLLETSSVWDLRTTLIVRFLRSLLAGEHPVSVSRQQKSSLLDPGMSGPMWISSVTVPKTKADDDVLAHFLAAVDARKPKGSTYDRPQSDDMYAEWTGFRPNANQRTPHASELSDAERYGKLMADTKNDTTVLYFHGGALYLMDVASHRPVCSSLAKMTGGRCLNVRYRLAPKYPFPSALLDCFMAYLYLLSPPPGSFHKPVAASSIVFAGDSAGGNLSFALLQLLLELHRSSPSGQVPKLRYQGQEVEVPLPAGVACSSAWVDLTKTMPSTFSNHKFDYLPLPSGISMHERFPPCALWPVDPRREDFYCDGATLMHPFASPLATSVEDWKNSPPVFLFYGEEMLTDEGKYLARRLVRAGTQVQWEEFEAMPHCFAMLLRDTKVGKLGMSRWADFIARVTKGEKIETRGTFYKAKDWAESSIDVASLGDLTDNEVLERMAKEVEIKEGYLMNARQGGIVIQSKL